MIRIFFNNPRIILRIIILSPFANLLQLEQKKARVFRFFSKFLANFLCKMIRRVIRDSNHLPEMIRDSNHESYFKAVIRDSNQKS